MFVSGAFVMRIYKNELVGYIVVNNESGGIRQETVFMRLFNPLKQSGKYIYHSASKFKKYIFFPSQSIHMDTKLVLSD